MFPADSVMRAGARGKLELGGLAALGEASGAHGSRGA